jgi:N-acetylglucosaminyldiphosphoundecaprenol N-acetyl-beta-D-mannosaminyltransferase
MGPVLTDTGIKEVRLFDYRVHLASAEEGLVPVQSAVASGHNLHVVTLNPEMIMQGDMDPELGRIIRSAGLVIPDGTGVVWALKSQGHRIKRLPGIEFSEALLSLAQRLGWKVAVIGASPQVLPKAVATLHERFPNLEIAYSHHGFFKSLEEERQVAEACAAQQPSVVLIAMGAPRQEFWIDRFQTLFHGTVFVGVGGSLDVWSGTRRRAPLLMRKLNLEWLYRITTEPHRIRRIYKTLPLFVVKVLFSKV